MIYLEVGDSLWKHRVIPNEPYGGKVLRHRLKMSLRLISLLVG